MSGLRNATELGTFLKQQKVDLDKLIEVAARPVFPANHDFQAESSLFDDITVHPETMKLVTDFIKAFDLDSNWDETLHLYAAVVRILQFNENC